METKELVFEYVNWEGKRGTRRIRPLQMWYGKTKWHPADQWFLRGFDLDKNEERDFALKDIQKFL